MKFMCIYMIRSAYLGHLGHLGVLQDGEHSKGLQTMKIYLWTPQGCQNYHVSADHTIFIKDGRNASFLFNCLELLSRYRLWIETYGDNLIRVELENWDTALFQIGTQIITEIIDSMETLDMTYQTDLQGVISRVPSERESDITNRHESV